MLILRHASLATLRRALHGRLAVRRFASPPVLSANPNPSLNTRSDPKSAKSPSNTNQDSFKNVGFVKAPSRKPTVAVRTSRNFPNDFPFLWALSSLVPDLFLSSRQNSFLLLLKIPNINSLLFYPGGNRVHVALRHKANARFGRRARSAAAKVAYDAYCNHLQAQTTFIILVFFKFC